LTYKDGLVLDATPSNADCKTSNPILEPNVISANPLHFFRFNSFLSFQLSSLTLFRSGHFNRSVRLWAKKHGWKLTDTYLEPRDKANPAPLPGVFPYHASRNSHSNSGGSSSSNSGASSSAIIGQNNSNHSSSSFQGAHIGGGGDAVSGHQVSSCVPCFSEQDIFTALGLEWRAPEERNCDDVEEGDFDGTATPAPAGVAGAAVAAAAAAAGGGGGKGLQGEGSAIATRTAADGDAAASVTTCGTDHHHFNKNLLLQRRALADALHRAQKKY
jgi:hypothetical protein